MTKCRLTLLVFFITTLFALVLSTLRLLDRTDGLFVPSTNMLGPNIPEIFNMLGHKILLIAQM